MSSYSAVTRQVQVLVGVFLEGEDFGYSLQLRCEKIFMLEIG
jgi:hypothetical protein